MPFHIFLSQSLSTLTGGLTVWKIAKDVFLFLVTMFTICLVYQKGKAPRWFWGLVGVTAAYGALHLLVWAFHPHLYRTSALLGTIYNVRLLCFAVVGSGAVLLHERKFVFSSMMRVVLGVSTVVALLGVVQYFLPPDILTHVGYSIARGARPDFFIDNNPAFPRIMSTLRDPNSLGAYLLVPIATLTYLVIFLKLTARRRALALLALMLHVAALYLTFSRSAWAAGLVTMGLVVWWRYSSQFVRALRKWWPVAAVAVFLIIFGAYAERNNGIVSHTTTAQVGQYDSNQFHWLYVQRGLTGMVREPLGHGPGTAGLASIQNPGGGLLTENYYVQLGYEIGFVGLAVFIAVTVWLYVRLWRRHDGWTVVLLSSFWAYVLMNMLLHTWSNEAVAAQWWLLAGMALAVPLAQPYEAARRLRPVSRHHTARRRRSL